MPRPVRFIQVLLGRWVQRSRRPTGKRSRGARGSGGAWSLPSLHARCAFHCTLALALAGGCSHSCLIRFTILTSLTACAVHLSFLLHIPLYHGLLIFTVYIHTLAVDYTTYRLSAVVPPLGTSFLSGYIHGTIRQSNWVLTGLARAIPSGGLRFD